MTTKAQDVTIAERLSAVRSQAASLRADVQKLTDDARLALYEGKPIDTINAKRDAAQLKIDELELLISELERRLPAEQKQQLEAEMAAALAAEAEEKNKVVASRLRLKEMEAALERAYREHREVERQRDMVGGRSFTIGQKIRRHTEQYPNLWEAENV